MRKLKKITSRQKHYWMIFKEQKVLDIYQLNILTSIIFMSRIENETALLIFLTKFCKISHIFHKIFRP